MPSAVNCFHIMLCVNAAQYSGNYIKDNSECANPKVSIGPFLRIQFCIKNSWNNPVEHTKSKEAIPAQRTYVYVGDGPVGIMTDGIYTFQ